MKKKFRKLYMGIAKEVSKLSYCERRKVGAVLVSPCGQNILSFGYNGTVSGFPNVCELEDGTTDNKSVLHAELNAIGKITTSTQSSLNSILFVTLSPCVECAKIIIRSGISKVYYLEEYKDLTGIETLKKANIYVRKINS